MKTKTKLKLKINQNENHTGCQQPLSACSHVGMLCFFEKTVTWRRPITILYLLTFYIFTTMSGTLSASLRL